MSSAEKRNETSTGGCDLPHELTVPTFEHLQFNYDNLCARCSTIPWMTLSSLKDRELLLRISEPKKNWKPSTCDLCRLLITRVPPEHDDSSELELLGVAPFMHPPLNFGTVLLSTASGFALPRRDLFLTHLSIEEAQKYLSKWHPKSVDFDLVRSWVRACALAHEDCSHRALPPLQHLKVIDCGRREIVRAPINCDFVALSYVWGSSSRPEPLKTPNLDQDLPRTIEDSIKVTQELGYQYLWVDRYTNSTEKHGQIQQMGTIYSSAQVTLIACAGKDSTHGLPGVSAERQSAEAPGRAGPITLLPAPDESDVTVSCSVWAYRAWTYQEGFLSRRKLFFTDRQVIYICDGSLKFEVRGEDYSNGRSIVGTLTHCISTARDPGPYTSLLWPATNILDEYSTRHLSFQTDALDAISGALNALEDNQPSIRHFFGVPFMVTDTYKSIQTSSTEKVAKNSGPAASCTVTIATSWAHHQPAMRRSSFPSWSMLGWNGPAYHLGAFQPILSTDDTIKVFGKEEYQPLKSLLEIDSKTFRDSTTTFSQYLKVTASLIEFALESIIWDEESSTHLHARNGPYVIVPWQDTSVLCLWLSLDDATLGINNRSSLVCTTLTGDDEILNGIFEAIAFLVLDHRGKYYERVGVFDFTTFPVIMRNREGARHVGREELKSPHPWMQNLKKQTFLLG